MPQRIPPKPPKLPPMFDEGPWPDRCAPETDDQLAVFSKVGRGLRGNGYKVVIKYDDEDEMYLEGLEYDAASGTWSSDWISENISGGSLDYMYVLNEESDPKTFTITFKYSRPGREDWEFTTPPIPYIADPSGGGGDDTLPKVKDLFLKKIETAGWDADRDSKLVYPDGTDRSDYDAPYPEEYWTVNLTYGVGGDIDVPNTDELADILGISVSAIQNIVSGESGQVAGYDNFYDFILSIGGGGGEGQLVVGLTDQEIDDIYYTVVTDEEPSQDL